MSLKEGEIYECPECGCECTVTREPEEGKGGDQNPTCCCGKTMEKKN